MRVSHNKRRNDTATRSSSQKVLYRPFNPIPRLLKGFSLMATGGVLAAGVFLSAGLLMTGDRFLSSLGELFTAPQPEPKVDVRSMMLEQIRGASELTTAVFAMQAVVPASRDRTVAGYVIGKTTLLYIAYGEVRAGVDLSELTPQDIQITGDQVQLRLPAPRLLDSKIDINRSSVYDYDRGFLGLGPDAATELQTLAQRETLKQLEQTACMQGLLQTANDRAKEVVTQLLTTAGYQKFMIQTQPPSSEGCQSPTLSANDESPDAPSPSAIPE